MNNFKSVFTILFSYFLSVTAHAQFSIDQSLTRFTRLQSHEQCQKKENAVCSKNIDKFIEDEKENRALIIESRAKICYQISETSKSSKNQEAQNISAVQFLNNFNKEYPVSDFSLSTIRTCVGSSAQDQKTKISKFFYYQKRLNLGMQRVNEQRIKIQQALGQSVPSCPDANLFKEAAEKCEENKKCSTKSSPDQFFKKAAADHKVFFELKQQLSEVIKNCKTDSSCEKKKASLSLSLKSLTELNPWMLSSQFSKPNDSAFDKKLTQFLNDYDKELTQLEKKLIHAADCTHQKNGCNIDDIRNTLSLTPEITETYSKYPDSNELMRYIVLHRCLEDATLDRNKTAKIINETYLNLGLMVGTMGVSSLGQLSKTAGQLLWSRRAQLLSETVNTSLDVLNTSESLKETYDSCIKDGQIQLNNQTDNKLFCSSENLFLSPRDSHQQSCLVSAGISIASGLGLGFSVAKSSVLPRSQTAEISDAQKLDRRTSTTSPPIADKRITEVRKVDALKLEELKPVDAKSLGPATSNVRVYSRTNFENKTNYYSAYPVKASDGKTYRATQEIQFDEISGGINANYPAGRELFEKIAQEKAGRAHFAFIDVASLGAVNKTFKGGEAAGDRYIKAVADKVLEHGEGKVTLARLGGDEFGLIIDEKDPKKVQAILKNIQDGLRKDLDGEAKVVFRDEKIVRAEDFRKQKAALENENQGPLTEEQLSALREPIDTLAKIQQPDISIGSTQIGAMDSLEDLLSRSEKQATEMKIDTVLHFGRSAEKYGSKEVPSARPQPMYQSEVASPEASSSWRTTSRSSRASLDTLPPVETYRMGEVFRVRELSLTQYSDTTGRDIFKIEKYILDPKTQVKTRVEYEIPSRGSTGLLDGTHPESQNFIYQHFNSQADSMLVMPKLKSLRYLNYFEDGTKAGDTLLEAAADAMKKNMRSTDLTFKLQGADFIWSTKELSSDQLRSVTQRINEDFLKNEKVQTVLKNELNSLNAKLQSALTQKKSDEVEKLKEQIKSLQNFRPELSFETLGKKEVRAQSTFKDCVEALNKKFSN